MAPSLLARLLLPSHNLSSLPNPPAFHAFESHLAQRLLTLIQPSSSPYLSLNWLLDALSALLSTHTSLHSLIIPRLFLSPLSQSHHKIIHHYMDDTVKLLDICNVLKEVAAEIGRCLLLIQFALHYLHPHEGLSETMMVRARNALSEYLQTTSTKGTRSQQRSKLADCSFNLRRMAQKLSAASAANDASTSSGTLLSAMIGGQTVTLFVLAVLATALSLQPTRSPPKLRLIRQPLWATPLLTLQNQVREEVHRRKAEDALVLSEELHKVDATVKEAHALLEKLLANKTSPETMINGKVELRHALEALRKRTDDVQLCMGPLEEQIDGLYKLLLATRMTMLNSLVHLKT